MLRDGLAPGGLPDDASVVDELPVEDTLRRIVVLYRFLGWAWMVILVTLTLVNDGDANQTIVVGALVLATGWTFTTVWAARSSRQLGRTWFVLADLAVALGAGAATTISGAKELFHGGYPMSTLGVSAYAYGLRGALISSFVLGGEQVVVHLVDDRGLLPTVGSITFVVFAILLGWGFDAVRSQARRRQELQLQLDLETTARIRHQERVELANRLHDSVLQTLGALRRDAEDPRQVRYLARRQERQLRQTISEYRSPHEHSARAALRGACDEVEDLYHLEVDVVIRGDAELDADHEAVVGAAREALVNAAKHAGVTRVDVYAEVSDAGMDVFVRDRGTGFDTAATTFGRGLEHGLERRVEAVGGSVRIESAPGEGTEVAIQWSRA